MAGSATAWVLSPEPQSKFRAQRFMSVAPSTSPLSLPPSTEPPVTTTLAPPQPSPEPTATPPAPPAPVRIAERVHESDPASNRALGEQMAAIEGWVGAEWDCLDELWGRLESGWDHLKWNMAGSGAYGIPQALPGSKMGPGWETDPRVQIEWGLGYIGGRYGSPCGALQAHYVKGWY